MGLTDRTLLRLHVEAVWSVRLPAHVLHEIELLPDGSQPAWRLCAADLAEGRVHIWRPDVTPPERDALRQLVSGIMTGMPVDGPQPEVHREVALALMSPPRLSDVIAHSIARPLTDTDRVMIEAFDPGWQDYYYHLERRPLVGAVISGQLVSVAHSSRRTSEACELGVHTVPDARRKGYALAATMIWTQEITQEKLVPLYSADASNTASLLLADAAGYRAFARLVTVK